jgi:hypothetical protein
MNIDTQDKLSAQINQARGVLAALLADTCDLKRGSNLSTEMQNNALWVVDSLLEQAQKGIDQSTASEKIKQCLPR